MAVRETTLLQLSYMLTFHIKGWFWASPVLKPVLESSGASWGRKVLLLPLAVPGLSEAEPALLLLHSNPN